VKKILEYIQSFVTIGLVLAGIGGISYEMFKHNGWLEMIFGKIWGFQLDHPAVAIPVTIAVVVIGKLWYDHKRAKGYTSRLPDVLIYAVMAAGVYFIWRFASDAMGL
jgi:hypothetical protein